MEKNREVRQERIFDDEISLLVGWNVLVKQKRIIFAFILAALILGLAYVFITPPVYKAEAYLLPPLAKDVQGANVQGANIHSITPGILYAQLLINLSSSSVRKAFFNSKDILKYFLPEHYPENPERSIDVLFSEFNASLNLTREKKDKKVVIKNKQVVIVSFESNDASLSAKVVNGFIKAAHDETLRNLFDNIDYKIFNTKKGLREKIAGKRTLIKQKRQDEIAALLESDQIQINKLLKEISIAKKAVVTRDADRIEHLKEAIAIAKVLSIVEAGEKYRANFKTSNVSVNTADSPLYLRGVKALKTELNLITKRVNKDPFTDKLRNFEKQLASLKVNVRANILKARKNDDPFIHGLRDLQERLAVLNNITVEKDKVFAMRIDQQAITPMHPIKPTKRLTVLLVLLLGMILGVGAAFIRNAIVEESMKK